jgi:hypothetical protein
MLLRSAILSIKYNVFVFWALPLFVLKITNKHTSMYLIELFMVDYSSSELLKRFIFALTYALKSISILSVV